MSKNYKAIFTQFTPISSYQTFIEFQVPDDGYYTSDQIKILAEDAIEYKGFSKEEYRLDYIVPFEREESILKRINLVM